MLEVVHRDLALRNVLLAEDNVVPIAYRWMAPECLVYDGVYTSQSDVWAFGVTLWEIFSLGMTPYQGMKIHELVQNLQKGYRLECPGYANHRIHEIMLQCWEADPNNRPTFPELSLRFTDMLSDYERSRCEERTRPFLETSGTHCQTRTKYTQLSFPQVPEEEHHSVQGSEDPPSQRQEPVSMQENVLGIRWLLAMATHRSLMAFDPWTCWPRPKNAHFSCYRILEDSLLGSLACNTIPRDDNHKDYSGVDGVFTYVSWMEGQDALQNASRIL
ncbi:unnamed protein product [Darwinula stevensoni]|uniref:Protein kinase domain-containing protein n=1 Tax=Darwinula stevensoni TaxID=69355 RepID=A0A7R9ADM0_9CRUS|nr:unnamed protein product [Darwinula stevensoni]CAG0901243.1 unnamed protein product [Darwinula stevensoni]